MANINWQWMLFSLDGRLNRAPYWLVPLAMLVALSALCLLIYGLLGVRPAIFVGVAGAVVFVIAAITMGVKRLHDRNKSGQWLWLLYGVPAAIDYVGGLLEQSSPGLSLALTIFSLGISVWAIIELGFLRGDDGSNDFGPNPLAATSRRLG
jgi:uncharacterized membrane protein YhaH (DUF805 family)